MKIVFASNNKHKLQEIRDIIGTQHQLISMAEAGIHDDIAEPYDTLEENAYTKAEYVYKRTGLSCFADDSGLEVDALGGAPGVYSARYAGSSKNDADNMAKLLTEMQSVEAREAQFRTVVAFIHKGESLYFEGIAKGKILHTAIGDEGFGYDPIFMPLGFDKSFAQLSMAQKSKISHRGQAVRKFIDHIKTLATNQ